MARRKQATAEAIQNTTDTLTSPQLPEVVPPLPPEPPQVASERPTPDEPARQFRANPFPIKTTNVDGYKIQLQESRPEKARWEMQIKFGDGSLGDKPSDTIIDAIASHKITVETKNGPKEVNQFHWNNQDRAWGMEISFDAPRASRQKAEQVYADVVKLVAQELGATPVQGR
jgi:hypothetical protein